MTAPRPPVEQRVVAALDAAPSRIPVVLGGCGSGRTALLRRVGAQLASRGGSQYIDVERAVSTPEGFLAAVTADSPYAAGDVRRFLPSRARSAREAFEALLVFLGDASRRTDVRPTFLIDEVLDLRTFEHFPGLRNVLGDLIDALAASPNRFALASRWAARTLRLLRGRSERFEVIQLPRLSPAEVAAALDAYGAGPGADARRAGDRGETARMVHAVADGRPAYVHALGAGLAAGGADDVADVLATQLAPGAKLWWTCRFSYELRLARARGYGALRAILAVLADEEPLSLTEIAGRLGRTAGATRDYLSWLEDVDLVTARQKRYRFLDPLLRLWVRLHGRPTPPDDAALARAAREYAASRLPPPVSVAETAAALPASPAAPPRRPRRSWGLMEID